MYFFKKRKQSVQYAGELLRLQIRYSLESIQKAVVQMACCTLLWAVNANWNSDNRYWNVNANSVTNPNEWNAGNQVFVRDSLLFFRFGGSFYYQPFTPTSDHLADIFYLLTD